jgi:predicted MPP superfamily phosphohydrolase
MPEFVLSRQIMKQSMRKGAGRHARGRLARAITRPPFHDELGRKGWLAEISRAQRHVVRRLRLQIEGWPRWQRPLRVAFLSDLHTGSHADDVIRLRSIIDEAAALAPDLVLFGGDYVNMQPFGGGRVPPRTIAAILSRLDAPLGRFAILGNHDYVYGERAVADAFEHHGIPVLDHARRSMRFQNHPIDLVGVPDAHVTRTEAYALLAGLSPHKPTIVLAHDPVWFAHLPAGPHFMLAGHTHGGQIKLPGVGVVRTATKAPRRWIHGLVEERGQYLYVTSGIGTSGVPVRWGVPPEIAVLDMSGKT